ncbi:MAG TPA: archaetidylserine decarboxylase [Steroidobacteraceae bacterium]|jgi:phosphatidylserine decarboxylase|nr:archaetidylserine decarboxylase [Steroidobacteraceae bacterium]
MDVPTPSADSPPLRARLFVAMQHLLPQHFLSRQVHRLARCRVKPVKNALIGSFVRHFRPDMSEAADPEPRDYPSFNAFFTRSLRPGSRPCDPDPQVLACPVDGTVSQIGRLDGLRMLQAKGHDYSVEALLGGASAWTQRFAGGSFATLYLAPYNYHRIHMPAAGTLSAAWFIPGKLFSVNAVTAAAVPGLFARNERVVCAFEEGPLAFALALIGALFVGSIATVWHGDVTPCSSPRAAQLPRDTGRAASRLDRGAELGRFNMGSTVILLLPPGAAQWLPELQPGTPVRVGQTIARLRPP